MSKMQEVKMDEAVEVFKTSIMSYAAETGVPLVIAGRGMGELFLPILSMYFKRGDLVDILKELEKTVENDAEWEKMQRLGLSMTHFFNNRQAYDYNQ